MARFPLPAVGDRVFVTLNKQGTPRYVAGAVLRSGPKHMVTLLVFYTSGGPDALVSAPQCVFSVNFDVVDMKILPNQGGNDTNRRVFSAGAIETALDVLNRAVQLPNAAGDNIGVFVNIDDWRAAIELLREAK